MKTNILIEGMHCRSCELLIEEELKKIPGIKKVVINYKKGQAELYSDISLDMEKVEKAVIGAGYCLSSVKANKKPWFSKNTIDYKDLVFVLILLVVLYVLAKELGLTNLRYSTSNNPSSLAAVLMIGLVAGVSTCMALVGGLVLAISARHNEKHPGATTLQKFRPHLFFNLGRILSFFVLGGVVGLIGKAFQFSNVSLAIMIIFAGLVMLILGLQLIEIFPKISDFSLTLPSGLAKMFGLNRDKKEYSHFNSAVVGALTFFLPCGFTQAMQIYAVSSGSFIKGAAIMSIFAIGTTPGLLGLGGLTSIVKKSFASIFYKFVGVLIIILAIFNISNGLNLAGWKGFPNNSTQINGQDSNVKIENGVQVVNMTQTSAGYKPNKFTVQNNMPVKWIIDSKDASSCASSIVVSKIDIKKFLSLGENVIEFTPTQLGDIKFSCSMGMYTGKFTVVEGSPQIKILPSSSSLTNQGGAQSDFSESRDKNIQLIKATYLSGREDIQPKEFTVQAGKPVRFEIKSNVTVGGCMSSIALPGLVQTPQFLEKDKVIVFEFTPQKKGEYSITCSMGTVRGKIIVN
ncbi:MAG: sulfite exporter TauE/SafE family protein [Patescibacteria group bacterium]